MILPLVLIVALQADARQPSAKEIQLWLTYYYKKPRPELTLSSLAVVDRELQKAKGRSLADQVKRGGMRTFYAKVFEQNDQVVKAIGLKLASLPPGQRAFVSESLRRCGSEACARALKMDSASQVNAEPIATPGDLDDAWAAFCATGDAKYVKDIIGVLPWAEEEEPLNRLLTGGAARWSLASNAYQHRRVMAICEETARTSTGTTKRLLEEVISLAKAERVKKRSPEPE